MREGGEHHEQRPRGGGGEGGRSCSALSWLGVGRHTNIMAWGGKAYKDTRASLKFCILHSGRMQNVWIYVWI